MMDKRIAIFFVLILLWGCTRTPPIAPEPEKEIIPADPLVSIVMACPDTFEVGVARPINWDSKEAIKVDFYLDGLLIPVGLSGPYYFIPDSNHIGNLIIRLIAFSEIDSDTASKTITVIPQRTGSVIDPEPPGIVIMVQDTSEWGTPVPVKWSSWNAHSTTVTNVFNPGLNGEITLLFDSTDIGEYVFTATAFGDNGMTAVDHDTLIIVEKKTCPTVPPQEPILFLFSPDTMKVEEIRNIEWEFRHIDSLKLYVDYELVKTSYDSIGIHQVQFNQPGEIIVQAIGFRLLDTVPKSRTIVVVPKDELQPQVDPTITLIAPDTGTVGIPVPLSWYACDADSVNIHGVPNPGLSGTHSITFSDSGKKKIYGYAYKNGKVGTDSVETYIKAVSGPYKTPVVLHDTVFVCRLFPTTTVEVDIPISMHYRIKPTVLYDTQENNESFFLLVQHPDGSWVGPENPNASIYKIVEDMVDVDGERERFAGHFLMKEGMNIIKIIHFSFNEIWNNPDFIELKNEPFTPFEKVYIHKFYIEPIG